MRGGGGWEQEAERRGNGAKRAEGSGESVGERGNGEGWRKGNGCRSEIGWRERRGNIRAGIMLGYHWSLMAFREKSIGLIRKTKQLCHCTTSIIRTHQKKNMRSVVGRGQGKAHNIMNTRHTFSREAVRASAVQDRRLNQYEYT